MTENNNTVFINKKDFFVEKYEFTQIENEIFSNLKMLKGMGEYERVSGLLQELTNVTCANSSKSIHTLLYINVTHGGFLAINSSDNFKEIYGICQGGNHYKNATKNLEKTKISNIFFTDKNENMDEIIEDTVENITDNNLIIYIDKVDKETGTTNNVFDNDNNHNHNHDAWFKIFVDKYKPCIVIDTYNDAVLDTIFTNENYKEYSLSNSDIKIHIPLCYDEAFNSVFKYYKEENSNVVNYDNLIHLCIMVKNGGPQFETMLQQNMNIIDKWTILDTGSTDDTLDIIKRTLVGKKKGELYEEPFINFRDSRNRLLDLAGTACKYTLMLDDTYVIEGDLRSFLNETRGDQLSDSYTLYIKSDDTLYGSNRVIKSDRNLRYVHKIHEVITDKNNINIVIPQERASIDDRRFDYMEKRTYDRKKLDLKLLYEEVDENPHDPRAYYYLAQTYNLLEDYEKALYYFKKRAEFTNSGFNQERIDALFESARIMNFKLNNPWSECEEMYNKCYMADPTRPESLYFIGVHYYLENVMETAYKYFKRAFEIGFPIHCQYSLKPTLSFHFLPKFLCKICYDMNDYCLGKASAELFLSNNTANDDSYSEVYSWYKIYEKLTVNAETINLKVPEKPILCFHADGGFNKWSGSSILTIGVGGSETYIIEMARYIQRSGLFNVYVFCNCVEEENFEGVIYKPLNDYYFFIKNNYIHTCIVSRYSEYLPVTFKGYTENVYLVVHDLSTTGIVIPIDKKLKKIFCLTEWHVSYFTNIFTSLKDITVPFYYGIDFEKFKIASDSIVNEKQEYKFIYSSFPNRGLLPLLQIWPKIYEYQPLASLHIYCDIDGEWVNSVEKEMMQQIRDVMKEYGVDDHKMNIYYHGWVNKSTLAASWITADIWFYPCTFMETFCLTALEAAVTKTLVITNDLAALQNTVGNRGVIIKGTPTDIVWKEEALRKIKKYLDPINRKMKNDLVERNYLWASKMSWDSQAKKLLDEYILQETLEYKGMYNWTSDIPFNSKKIFLDVIQYFNDNYYKMKNDEVVKILEVGSYTGTSLINIVKHIPNSIGVGIDKWEDYIETNRSSNGNGDGNDNTNDNGNNKVDILFNICNLGVEDSFHKNVASEGLEDRIMGVKGDSYEVLSNMIKDNKTFDFIYIDGSHLAFDCYSDLILSWKLLEKGGIMAVDDYLYNKNSFINSPFEGVNHFLKKFENEIKILHKDYRVFLEKM